ncbi:hypothetical protein PC9H_010540 [Pleurotus ostreatus]|uniref:Uncharacterized protein n=2 Tax=Pleurotus TaxID=5320 RepID=A0A8H7DNQ8_PLEOS|nr:uncharacterized protein PC9H_010540 [Pleurotus ostreatus]KAF7422384.1 hypothetical protein PC9H_010540 [Pleurotus ostreatus]KAG9227728.1 hypothetical protein CCMSSC00406_0000626 [Pleurotus cornucopiae]KAJ8691784.1 hypothetical protein PTI98_011319 [Pleurotus ostreatus]
MDYDDAWCPVCGREIIPKRYLVPIQPDAPPAPAPAPPPSSPQSSPTKLNGKKSKTTRTRVAGGLVQGTGRVKPNGALKPPPPPTPAVETKTTNSKAQPPRTRLVIDPAPLPLYCSDECRVADMHFSSDIHPLGHATTRSTLSRSPDSMSSSTNTSGSTVDSRKSSSSGYGFPPVPPLVTSTSISPPSSADEWEISPTVPSKPFDAKKTLRSLVPEPRKRQQFGNYIVPPEPLKEIRGWTDDSNAWRATVYGLVDTDPSDLAARPEMEEVYRKHNACAHRAKGVYSTVGTKDISTIPAPAPSPRSYEDELLLYNYHSSFVRARSLTPSCASGKSRSPPTKQRPLVHPLAQGKLLAPNLKLRDHTGSCSSLSSSTVRSPSSKGSQVEGGAYGYKRPVIETRSWSYDNVPTYQPMKMPPSIEKRKVKQIVDGVEKEVTIEVEVENNGKRLFNFPDKEYYTRR